MICNLCYHSCDLELGEVGLCSVIKNNFGTIENIYGGQFSNIAVESIEKRPFFHYMPGSKFLSCGSVGCNFFCDFCTNYKVSQSVLAKTKYLSPSDLHDLCIEKKASGFAFTYNEPTLFVDYLCSLRKNSDLPIVLKTNGYASKPVMSRLFGCVNAFNVDIKGDDSAYRELCGGTLQPVLDNIEWIVDHGLHLEISYLVVESVIDDENFHKKIASWLQALDSNIPIHILYYYPAYKVEKSYEMSKLLKVVEIFKKHMSFVYVSNVFNSQFIQHRNTYCPSCESLMILRTGQTNVVKDVCCGEMLPIKGWHEDLG